MMTILTLLLLATLSPAPVDLTGRIVDLSGNPIANAHIYIYTARPKAGVSPFCPSCYKDCGKHEDADPGGAFVIRALDRSLLFNILAVADGWEPRFAENVDPSTQTVTIRLAPRVEGDPRRAIRGTVIDPKGKPVVGAVVEPQGYHKPNGAVGYGNIPGVDKLSITNAKGEFALRVPDAGAACDVRVRARNFAPMIARDLQPGRAARLEVRLGVTISGRVMRDGKPVAGSLMGFVQRSRASRTFLGPETIATNEDGLFVMTSLAPNEDYVVYGIMSSFAPNTVPAKPVKTGDDASSVDAGTFTVEAGRKLTGRVVLPEGWALAHHLRVLLGRIAPWDSQTAELREDGSFEFNGVPSEDVTISARVPGLRLLPESDGFDRYQVRITADRDRDVKLFFGQ